MLTLPLVSLAWYYVPMSIQQHTGVPPTLPGQVIQPQAVLDPMSVAAHNFTNVLRKLVSESRAYKSEGELHAALDAIDAFELRLIPLQDRQHVLTETDWAGREDVSKREAPYSGSTPPVPAAAPQLDYGRLAEAILYAQQQQSEQETPGE